jgi:hypothetical protein
MTTVYTMIVMAAFAGEPLDGYDRLLLLEKAKQVAAQNARLENPYRRQAVFRSLDGDYDEAERRWLQEVADWSSRPYDFQAPPVYYYQPVRYYLRGSCAGGTCPR